MTRDCESSIKPGRLMRRRCVQDWQTAAELECTPRRHTTTNDCRRLRLDTAAC